LIRPAELLDERDFAHPAELDFSRILTFYRVRWSYEPTTFPIAFAADGRPTEMFTPDFYLPEHKVYIELTTMRQRLVTRKNRKIRRLRELYPDVRIKLLYRRDYDRLVDAYRAAGRDPTALRAGRVLFSEEQIRRRIGELAAAIAEEAAADAAREMPGAGPLLLLGVNRGSAVFVRQLAAALAERGVRFEGDRISLSRYRSPVGERRVRVGSGPRAGVAGRRVLLVTDIVSTGLSLAYLTRWLGRRGARRVDVCSLLDRQGARLVELPVRHAGFEAPNELLVGFGLHLRRQFRDLPYIAALAEEETAGGATVGA
jgi:hypoxanthine phosphoribosyltransferase